MKRVGDLFGQIAERENLRWAFFKALRGKRTKADAIHFASRLDQNLWELSRQLHRGQVPVGDYQQFIIYDPKERLITAPSFRERVLHHAIMNVCEPVFDRRLIDDTFACRLDKGRLAAMDRAAQFAARHGFFLKLDMRKYFDSISHEILGTLLERMFKERPALDLFQRIIRSYETAPGRGLPIGSLTSQHFANFYLAGFDRFAKERLRVRGYVRYMDDCILWADTAGELTEHLAGCRHWLADHLELHLKPEPYINRTEHGMDFLGNRIFRHHQTLSRQSRRRFRRKLYHLEMAWLMGEIDEATLQRKAESMFAFAMAGDVRSWQFRRSVLEQSPVSGQGQTDASIA